MKYLKLISIILIFVACNQQSKEEENKDNNITFTELYPLITDISIGPFNCDEEMDGCNYYRLLIITIEIYDCIYIEKITTDEEAYNREISKRYKVPTKLFTNFSTVRTIKILEWLKYDVVKIKVDENIFILYLSEELSGLNIEKL